jgi:IclR family transcriptional regulator, KDG regulon repressor
MSTTKNISAVARTFVILEKLSSVSSSGVEDLARSTGLAKATVYRFLLTLKALGYVRRDEGDRWYLTLKLFSVGSRALDHIELPAVSKPVAENLSASLGETVHLGILDDDEVLYVLKVESRCTIRMYSRVGKRIPLYCSAMGKVLFANLPVVGQKTLLGSIRMIRFTPNTLKDRKALEAELARVREAGFAVDAEEHEQGITCIAAPIRDSTGSVTAALSVSWPVFRFEAAQKESYIRSIRKAAAEISSILGFTST